MELFLMILSYLFTYKKASYGEDVTKKQWKRKVNLSFSFNTENVLLWKFISTFT